MAIVTGASNESACYHKAMANDLQPPQVKLPAGGAGGQLMQRLRTKLGERTRNSDESE